MTEFEMAVMDKFGELQKQIGNIQGASGEIVGELKMLKETFQDTVKDYGERIDLNDKKHNETIERLTIVEQTIKKIPGMESEQKEIYALLIEAGELKRCYDRFEPTMKWIESLRGWKNVLIGAIIASSVGMAYKLIGPFAKFVADFFKGNVS